MSKHIEIEMPEPKAARCDCCGGMTVTLTRFVYRDGNASAVYYAAYSNNHPDAELAMLVSLGEWGEGSEPSKRAAFFCKVRPTNDSYEVMLADAQASNWSNAEIVGQKLSRKAALAHPWKTTAFDILDEAFRQDPSLRGFLHRAQCGTPAVPLEKSFQAPDDIFALGEKHKSRVMLRRNFASLDDKRFFVRCLLALPVEDYGTWCVGLWVEVTKSDFDHVQLVWNDAKKYPSLRFAGTVANDFGKDLNLPLGLGSSVQLEVTDPESPPTVRAKKNTRLGKALSNTWSRSAFEAYALARGFL